MEKRAERAARAAILATRECNMRPIDEKCTGQPEIIPVNPKSLITARNAATSNYINEEPLTRKGTFGKTLEIEN